MCFVYIVRLLVQQVWGLTVRTPRCLWKLLLQNVRVDVFFLCAKTEMGDWFYIFNVSWLVSWLTGDLIFGEATFFQQPFLYMLYDTTKATTNPVSQLRSEVCLLRADMWYHCGRLCNHYSMPWMQRHAPRTGMVNILQKVNLVRRVVQGEMQLT